MFAVGVVAVLFTGILVVTWLTARAEEARTRCDEHVRHIQHHLELPASPGWDAQRGHPPRADR